MKKAVRKLFETVNEGERTLLLDMNDMELLLATGLSSNPLHKKSAGRAGGWLIEKGSRITFPLAGSDFSGFRYVSFSLFAGVDAIAPIQFELLNDKNRNGYIETIYLQRNGWTDFCLDLQTLSSVGSPIGFSKIDSISLTYLGKNTQTQLFVDNFYLQKEAGKPFYSVFPEGKGGVLFHTSGKYAIADRKRMSNGLDDAIVSPMLVDGKVWAPIAPFAGAFGHLAIADNKAGTISFVYRRKKYVFTADTENVQVEGEMKRLSFRPKSVSGVLLFPSDFLCEFFRLKYCHTFDRGLIFFTNRKTPLSDDLYHSLEKSLCQALILDFPSANEIVSDLHKQVQNPNRCRLFLSPEQWSERKKAVKTEAQLKTYLQFLKEDFGTKNQTFHTAPVKIVEQDTLEERCALLSTSAEKLLAIATIFRMTGDKAYSNRAFMECEALAQCDWYCNAYTFGQVSFVVACAYDWCHHVWDEGQKATIERGMLQKGLRVGLSASLGSLPIWNVASGDGLIADTGLLSMALALADVYPETVLKVFDKSLSRVYRALSLLQNDGGCISTGKESEKIYRSLTYLSALFTHACGTDYGFSTCPGFLQMENALLSLETKNGALEASDGLAYQNNMAFYMAEKTDNFAYAWMRRQKILSHLVSVHPMDFVFYTSVNDDKNPAFPMDSFFRNSGKAVLKSGLGDDANVVMISEFGTKFAMELGGIRFFTAVVNDASLSSKWKEHSFSGVSMQMEGGQLVSSASHKEFGQAIFELDGSTKKNHRQIGARLFSQRSVLQYQWDFGKDNEQKIVVNFVTDGTVTLLASGKIVVIEKEGKQLVARFAGLSEGLQSIDLGNGFTALTISYSKSEKCKGTISCKLLEDGEKKNSAFCPVVPFTKWLENENE